MDTERNKKLNVRWLRNIHKHNTIMYRYGYAIWLINAYK